MARSQIEMNKEYRHKRKAEFERLQAENAELRRRLAEVETPPAAPAPTPSPSPAEIAAIEAEAAHIKKKNQRIRQLELENLDLRRRLAAIETSTAASPLDKLSPELRAEFDRLVASGKIEQVLGLTAKNHAARQKAESPAAPAPEPTSEAPTITEASPAPAVEERVEEAGAGFVNFPMPEIPEVVETPVVEPVSPAPAARLDGLAAAAAAFSIEEFKNLPEEKNH
ncbi:hypothetical protein [Methylocystis sp.]|uniref:hypothetical protein n=1 Tax=Methylocystis sp. TaxID=1911079 RepID=UPI003DA3C1DD